MDGPTGPVNVTNHWPISCLFFNWKFAILKASLGSKRKAPHTASSWKPSIAALYREPFFNAVNTSGSPAKYTTDKCDERPSHAKTMSEHVRPIMDTDSNMCYPRSSLCHFEAIYLVPWQFIKRFQLEHCVSVGNYLLVLCYTCTIHARFWRGGGRGKRTLNAPRQ